VAHAARGADGRPLAVVHRDVSPPNVLISFAGEVKLGDFGLARAADRITSTQPGLLKGKIAYAAPELFRARPADARSDLWSLGVVLYELLTGEPPYAARTVHEVLDALDRGLVIEPPSRIAPVDASLDALVLALLEPDPAQRMSSALELADTLGWYVERLAPAAPIAKRLLANWARTLVPERGLPIEPIGPPRTSVSPDAARARASLAPTSASTSVVAPLMGTPPPAAGTPRPMATPAPPVSSPGRGSFVGGSLVGASLVGASLTATSTRGAPSLAPPPLAPPSLAPPSLAPPSLAPPSLAPPSLAPPSFGAPSLAPPSVFAPRPSLLPPPAPPAALPAHSRFGLPPVDPSRLGAARASLAPRGSLAPPARLEHDAPPASLPPPPTLSLAAPFGAGRASVGVSAPPPPPPASPAPWSELPRTTAPPPLAQHATEVPRVVFGAAGRASWLSAEALAPDDDVDEAPVTVDLASRDILAPSDAEVSADEPNGARHPRAASNG
jgi:serine/threonine-protein kinase